MFRLFKTNILPLFLVTLFCTSLFAGSGIPYIDIGTSTPTANRVVKFDANAKLPASALSGSITSSQLSSNLSFVGTASGNFYGTHTGNGSGLIGVSATVAFSTITGTPTTNTFFTTTPSANKVPYSTDGTLDSWVSGIFKVITLPATTTAQIGSTTASKMYTLRSQVGIGLGGGDTNLHANTKLLVRAEGANGSQSFVDSSTLPYTITTTGQTNISSSVYKFGTGSAYFDGAGDYLSVPDNDDWTWGTGDYTIRGWFNPDDSTSGGMIIAHGDGGENFWYCSKTTTGKLYFYIQPGGGPYTTLLGPTTYNVGSWNHFAMAKAGTTYRTFLNGSLQFETTQATTVGNYAQTLKIGIHMNASDVPYKGYMDNIEMVKGTALYTGTFTVPIADYFLTFGTITQHTTKIVSPSGVSAPHEILQLQTFDTVNNATGAENSYAAGTPTVLFMNGSITVFNSATKLGSSGLYAAHFNGGLLSNDGYYALCFDNIKVITDDNKASLRNKYLDSFYNIKVKESYARKGNIPWLDATDKAKRQYKQEKFESWKSANIGLAKYYVNEFLPGSGTVQSFQVGAFETDYNNFAEESWASDLAQKEYIQDVKDEQDMDKTRKMLRPSLSDPATPAIIKATDGSGLSLDNSLALSIMAIQEQDERLRNMRAEIEALKALINK